MSVAPRTPLILHTSECEQSLALIPEDLGARTALIWSPLAPQWTQVAIIKAPDPDGRELHRSSPRSDRWFYAAHTTGWPLGPSAASRRMTDIHRTLAVVNPQALQAHVRTRAAAAVSEMLGGPHVLDCDPVHLGRLVARSAASQGRPRTRQHDVWL